MLTVPEAIAEILAHVTPLPLARLPLINALGLVLAEDAICDLDSPPFDKALMDGYAVRTADLVDGQGTLHVVAEVMAGQVAQRPVGPEQAIRIMTGARVPEGADAVVPIEHTREHTRQEQGESPRDEVMIDSASIASGKNIFKRGESTRKGERVVPAGRQLRGQEIGALAELGKAEVAVYGRPRVAVLATGDELVPVGSLPGPGQIRNSNETMLVAQLCQMGAVPHPLGVARDDPDDLRAKISQGLAYDMLLLSGGVSAGKLDLVPSVLAEMGVRQVFHKVRVKPGQPIWFGVLEPAAAGKMGSVGPGSQLKKGTVPLGSTDLQGDNRLLERDSPLFQQPARCHVFGLPGNPVSSMVCCELFVRTAIRRLMGIEPAATAGLPARLTSDHFNSGNRPTYHPARWELSRSGAVVEPVKWNGSADLSATVEANAMVLFATSDYLYRAGDVVEVFVW